MNMVKEIMGWLWAIVCLIVAIAATCAAAGFIVGFGLSVASLAYRFWR